MTFATDTKPGFTSLPPERTGIHFTNHLSDEAASRNSLLEDGGGVAAGDVDGDGLCDLYFVSKEGGNALYRNSGDWHFEDITAQAGVACAGQRCNGAVFADVDGDGHLDLLVSLMGGGVRLFLNDGHGRFTDATTASGLAQTFGAHTLALADVQGEGRLDLFVANYRTDTIKNMPRGSIPALPIVDGKLQAPPAFRDRFQLGTNAHGTVLLEMGEPSCLYLNRGHARFEPVPWDGGRFRDEDGNMLKGPYLDWSLSAMFHDINGDGAPDLYICNDFFSPDRIWINDGNGNFKALPKLAMRKSSLFSMAIDFADINRDGHDDFIVLDMLSRDYVTRQVERANVDIDKDPWWGWPLNAAASDSRWQVLRNTLFINRGDTTFAEVAQLAGVQAADWAWNTVFLDVDLDGYEDLLVCNGHPHDVNNSDALASVQALGPSSRQTMSEPLLAFPPLLGRNLAFRNRRDLSFQEISAAWGFDLEGVSQGMALADLDNDGDLDVVINRLNAAPILLRNNAPAGRLLVRLHGAGANTRGIGARIKVTGGPVTQTGEMTCGGRYLSSDDPARMFAAGSPTNVLVIEVTWRSGKRTVINGVRANRVYEIL